MYMEMYTVEELLHRMLVSGGEEKHLIDIAKYK